MSSVFFLEAVQEMRRHRQQFVGADLLIKEIEAEAAAKGYTESGQRLLLKGHFKYEQAIRNRDGHQKAVMMWAAIAQVEALEEGWRDGHGIRSDRPGR